MVKIWRVAWPLDELDVWPFCKPLGDDSGLVAWCSVLKEVALSMLVHKKLQFLIRQVPVALPIHHFTLLQELQTAMPHPAEAPPGHHLGGMLHCLLGELLLKAVRARGGHAQLFFESAIAIPQLEGSSSAIAITQLFKDMLLRNRNSAIPQLQFFLKSATSSPQLRSFNSAFFDIVLDVESGRFIEKKNPR